MATETDSCNIQVVCRLRPMNEREERAGTLPVVTASTEKKEVTVIRGSGQRQVRSAFVFDHVFTSFSTQEEVFRETLAPVIDDVLGGYESTVFAYGQTGTGKTYTMEGDITSESERGVIPRAAQAIFQKLSHEKYIESSITASYLEIYNEELCDLLAASASSENDAKLQIVEDKRVRGKGVFCMNLSEQQVASPADVLALMQRAQEKRRVGETKMNKQSSRSHCLFTLKVNSKATLGDGSVMECTGKLHMVDLAGSECAKSAGQDPSRERERKNINQSLLTLGRVITALRANGGQQNQQRIPYRDSKLTRLLQESLGGRCKTVIVATLSPSILAVEETLSTLTYAQAAHGIENKPVATSYLKMTRNPMAMCMDASVKGDAAAGGGCSIQDWKELECRLHYMEAQVEEAQAALARKHREQQEIIDRAIAAENERDATVSELNRTRNMLEESNAARKGLEIKLGEATIALNHKEMIICAYKQTETALHNEASTLLRQLETSIAEGDGLHQQLVANINAEKDRRKETQQFTEQCVARVDTLEAKLQQMVAHLDATQQNMSKIVDDAHTRSNKAVDSLEALVSQAIDTANDDCAKVHALVQSSGLKAEEDLVAITSRMQSNVCNVKSVLSTAVASLIKEGLGGLLKIIEEGDQQLINWGAQVSSSLEQVKVQLQQVTENHTKEISSHREWSQNQLLLARDSLTTSKAAAESIATALQQHCKQLKSIEQQVHQLSRQSSEEAAAQTKKIATQKAVIEETVAGHKKERQDQKLLSTLESLGTTSKATTAEHIGCLEQQDLALNTQITQLKAHAEALKIAEQQQRSALEQSFARVLAALQDQMKTEFESLAASFTAQTTQQCSATNQLNLGVTQCVSANQSLKNQVAVFEKKLEEHRQAAQGQVSHWSKVDAECDKVLLGQVLTINNDISAAAVKLDNTVKEACTMVTQGMVQVQDLTNEQDARVRDLSLDLVQQHNTMGAVSKEIENRFTKTGENVQVVKSMACDVFVSQAASVAKTVAERQPILHQLSNIAASAGESLQANEREALKMLNASQQDLVQTADNQRSIWSKLTASREDIAQGTKKQLAATHQKASSEQQNAQNNRKFADSELENHLKEMAQMAAASKTQHHAGAEELKENVHHFSNGVIRANEAVEEPKERLVILYSKQFSKTPSDEDILQLTGGEASSPASPDSDVVVAVVDAQTENSKPKVPSTATTATTKITKTVTKIPAVPKVKKEPLKEVN